LGRIQSSYFSIGCLLVRVGAFLWVKNFLVSYYFIFRQIQKNVKVFANLFNSFFSFALYSPEFYGCLRCGFLCLLGIQGIAWVDSSFFLFNIFFKCVIFYLCWYLLPFLLYSALSRLFRHEYSSFRPKGKFIASMDWIA
jgi:hypothetical protein